MANLYVISGCNGAGEYSGLYCTTQSGVKCTMIPEQSVQLFSVVFCI